MNSSFRVTFVLGAPGLGGAELQLHKYCSDCPHEISLTVVVMSPAFSAVEWLRFQELFPDATLANSSSGRMSLRRFFRLIAAVRDSRADIVHTFMDGSAGAYGGLVAILLGKKWIHSSRALNPFMSRANKFLQELILPRAKLVLANSFSIKERILSSRFSPLHVRVILNGVDCAKFQSNKNTSRIDDLSGSRPFVFGFLGKFRAEKRIDLLLNAIEAMQEIKNQFCVNIGGDGPLLQEVTERIQSNPFLQKVVSMRGLVKDVPGFMQSIDCLVLCSDHEGTPNVVLEAMACEVPVISTNISNVGEIIKSSGWLVPPGAAAALAERMKEVMGMPTEELASRGKVARNKILAEYELVAQTREFWGVHRQVFANSVIEEEEAK
jgi:glycosyltransferase involved in cell wall biosynthesis